MLFNFFINFGPGISTYLLPAKLYNPEYKATGHGLAAGTGKLGAFIGTVCLPILQAQLGIYLTLAILASTLLLGWLLTQWLEHEEKKLVLLPDKISESALVSMS